MKKEIIGILVIMLFVGTGVLPAVSANIVDINATDINTNSSAQDDSKSTDYKHIKYFIVGTIKDKQKNGDNSYIFTIVIGLFVVIAGYVYITPWINEPIYLIYDFKIGYFGNNFICAMFFLPLPGSAPLI